MNEKEQWELLSVELLRKKVKHLHLKILPPDGRVRVVAPLRMSLKEIRGFTLSKFSWIQEKQEECKQLKEIPTLQYISGETHSFLGNSYELNVIEGHVSSKVELCENTMHFYVPFQATKEQKEKLIEHWYKKQLKPIFQNLITHWEPRMGVLVEKFRIQKMKTRWGSCNINSRNISFNLELGKKSLECLESVVIHEMVHLLEPSHNHRFKALMDEFMPDWRLYKKILEKA